MIRHSVPSVDRRGIALALTLWVLVVTASLLTVAVYLGFQDQRASGTGRRQLHTLTHGESGLVDAVVRWKPPRLSRLLPQAFDTLAIGGAGMAGNEEDWQGTIHRLNPGLFLVAVSAGDGSLELQTVATQTRLGWVARTRPVDVRVSAALTAGGRVTLGDGAVVSGRDHSPEGSDCTPPDTDIAGVEADSVVVASGARIDGAPPTVRRQSLDSGLNPPQRLAFDQLAADPTISLPGGSWFPGPVVTGAHCDAVPALNWGDPTGPENPCGGYLPIVHVAGDATLMGGEAQGILLVDGNLVIRGPFRFSGLVMVAGTFDVATPDTGVTLGGAVVAARTGFASHPTFVVAYSTCLISRALQTSGTLVPLPSRSWKELF